MFTEYCGKRKLHQEQPPRQVMGKETQTEKRVYKICMCKDTHNGQGLGWTGLVYKHVQGDS